MSFIIKIQYEKIKDIKSQLSERKYELYLKLYDVFFELVEKKDTNTKMSKKIEKLLLDIKKEMFIYAPDKIIEKFLDWYNNDLNEPNVFKRIYLYSEILILIRKDMGNQRSKTNENDLIRSILSSHEEFLKFKKEIS